jgi:hypothetical protein
VFYQQSYTKLRAGSISTNSNKNITKTYAKNLRCVVAAIKEGVVARVVIATPKQIDKKYLIINKKL